MSEEYVKQVFMDKWKELYSTLAITPRKLLVNMKREGARLHRKGTMEHYAHLVRGGNILAVAHIDTVQEAWGKSPRFDKGVYDDGTEADIMYHPNLDDRIGVFTILHMLPALGVKVDVLLCDYEELGRSTAQFFETTDKEYNWMVEFDRAGDDIVLYQYDYGDWRKKLKKAGFKIGHGSFSDISDLDDVGVQGVNIGVGYQKYHSKDAYMVLDEYFRNLSLFVKFWRKHKNTKFEHEGWGSYRSSYYGSYGRGGYGRGGTYHGSVYDRTETFWEIQEKAWKDEQYKRAQEAEVYYTHSCEMCGTKLSSTDAYKGFYITHHIHEGEEKEVHMSDYACGLCLLESWNYWTNTFFVRKGEHYDWLQTARIHEVIEAVESHYNWHIEDLIDISHLFPYLDQEEPQNDRQLPLLGAGELDDYNEDDPDDRAALEKLTTDD